MRVLVYANFKGGVGKTTNSVMTAYQLAKNGYKTLVCDLDPQANATQLLSRTYKRQTKKDLRIDETMMVALSEQTIDKAIVKIIDNLYLLPSDDDFTEYPKFLERKFLPTKEGYEETRIGYFSSQLSKVKDDYDYVIVDVPPTLSIFTDSAVYASDDIIIVLQTQQQSLDGAIGFFNYLQRTYDEYQPVDFDILGVLPVLLENRAGLDSQILQDARKVFGKDKVFKNIIKHMQRLKRYGREGIADKDSEFGKGDFHDIRVHYVYNQLTKEILDRVKKASEQD